MLCAVRTVGLVHRRHERRSCLGIFLSWWKSVQRKPYSTAYNRCRESLTQPRTIIFLPLISADGRDSSVSIATRYGAGRSGDRIPVEVRFSAAFQTGPVVHPASYTIGTGSFPGIKRPRRGVGYPPHLAPMLKKIVELHLYSTPGSS